MIQLLKKVSLPVGLPPVRGIDTMRIEEPKPLPVDLHMPCYACETEPATHVCRYQVGELAVQVCLCGKCMKMDTQCLLKNTIGLQEGGEPRRNEVIMA